MNKFGVGANSIVLCVDHDSAGANSRGLASIVVHFPARVELAVNAGDRAIIIEKDSAPIGVLPLGIGTVAIHILVASGHIVKVLTDLPEGVILGLQGVDIGVDLTGHAQGIVETIGIEASGLPGAIHLAHGQGFAIPLGNVPGSPLAVGAIPVGVVLADGIPDILRIAMVGIDKLA